MKQQTHIEGSHIKKYLSNLKRWDNDVDGAYELAMSRLRKRGGPQWTDRLAQVDIINVIVDSVREYDGHWDHLDNTREPSRHRPKPSGA